MRGTNLFFIRKQKYLLLFPSKNESDCLVCLMEDQRSTKSEFLKDRAISIVLSKKKQLTDLYCVLYTPPGSDRDSKNGNQIRILPVLLHLC